MIEFGTMFKDIARGLNSLFWPGFLLWLVLFRGRQLWSVLSRLSEILQSLAQALGRNGGSFKVPGAELIIAQKRAEEEPQPPGSSIGSAAPSSSSTSSSPSTDYDSRNTGPQQWTSPYFAPANYNEPPTTLAAEAGRTIVPNATATIAGPTAASLLTLVLKTTSHLEGEDRVLDLATRVANLAYAHDAEWLYNRILGSQLKWLQELHANGGGMTNALAHVWFSNACDRTPGLGDYGFDNWISFLIHFKLVLDDGSSFRLTVFGKDFVAYVAAAIPAFKNL